MGLSLKKKTTSQSLSTTPIDSNKNRLVLAYSSPLKPSQYLKNSKIKNKTF